MGTGYLLDSDVIIGYLTGRIPLSGMDIISTIVDRTPHISVISQIEVLRTIELCKHNRIKLPDAIIAATAMTENFLLVTRNIDDFKRIPNLELLNPWNILT